MHQPTDANMTLWHILTINPNPDINPTNPYP